MKGLYIKIKQSAVICSLDINDRLNLLDNGLKICKPVNIDLTQFFFMIGAIFSCRA